TGKSQADATQRAAAWALIVRLTPDRASLVRILANAKGDDGRLLDLRAGAADPGVVPDHIDTATSLRVIHTPPFAEFWSRARAAVARLHDAQRNGLQLRHLAMLAYLADHQSPLLGMSRDDLLTDALAFDA